MPTLISAPSTLEITVDTPLLRLATAVRPFGALLRCAGEIDVSNAGWLEAALAGLVERGVPELQVDLCGVEYLDAAAIRALLRAYHTLARSGRRLSVRVGPRAFRLFALLKLDRVLEVDCARERDEPAGARQEVERSRTSRRGRRITFSSSTRKRVCSPGGSTG